MYQSGCRSPFPSMALMGSFEGEILIDAKPGACVAMPLDIKAVFAFPIEAGEWRVEFSAEVFGEAGSVSLNEAIIIAEPFSADVDGVVELCLADFRQESWLERAGDEYLTSLGDGGLFLLGYFEGSGPYLHAATSVGLLAFRQFQGSSSSSRLTG